MQQRVEGSGKRGETKIVVLQCLKPIRLKFPVELVWSVGSFVQKVHNNLQIATAQHVPLDGAEHAADKRQLLDGPVNCIEQTNVRVPIGYVDNQVAAIRKHPPHLSQRNSIAFLVLDHP